ncbi:HAD family hydrolase [Ohtaekwangia sp.]|uniref:HAD family hydrolase n=1 Tax=Ohtaekwangia sp. TaxID=2066019 RepID=UPI002F938B8E
MGIIFDLDETLVDTTAAIHALKNEDWEAAEKQIPKFSLYPGILELLAYLKVSAIKMAVVSTSPHQYCEKILTHFHISCGCIIGNDDCARKPSPEPMVQALERLALDKNKVIALGDKAKDIISAKRCGIATVGCLWGAQAGEIEKLAEAKPDFTVSNPLQIIPILRDFFHLKL